uniref:F-box domain-containing protein n=1 Tax=Timema tahoe TaxID=61484 RepID=A0A7R9NZX4_9NEOP|nr:unnamed protein product [Timema tahoe]
MLANYATKTEHSLLCPNEKVPCINAGNGCPAIMFRYKRARHLEVCPASVVVCTMEWSRPWMCTHDFKLNPCRTFNSSHKHQLDIALALQDRRMWNKWKEIPAIQSQLGIIPLMKPICHFLCARPFRRDEYCWHYKNVHSDIHGGLNGWLEHRCPLAGEGCMYSLRRIHPCATEASVIHSDILESFGVTLQKECNNSNIKEIPKGESILQPNGGIITHPQVEFDHLPFEVLRYICRFIDSFSLCNLSLTSRRIRDVCHSLVKERGIMVQKWKRSAIDGEVHWTVSSQHWLFSTAFSPVEKWRFEEEGHMSNHLKNCHHYERNVHSKPFKVMGFN